MVKAFTDEDREVIKQKLLLKGAELLSIYGIRKTSVEDIAKAVGISKGAFYGFFNSKEEFFFEIFEMLEAEVKKKMQEQIFSKGRDNREGFKMFLTGIFEHIDSNPVFKLMNSDDMQYLVRNIPQEKIEEHFNRDDDFASDLFMQYIDHGIMKELKPEVLSGFFRALIYVRVHKEEIGEKIYPEVMKLFIDMIGDYFVK